MEHLHSHDGETHHHGLIDVSLPVRDTTRRQEDKSFVGGGWYFYADFARDYAWQDAVFSPEETQTIIRLGQSLVLRKGMIDDNRLSDLRKSEIAFIYPSDETGWIFDRLCAATLNLNNQHFNFDLDSFCEGLQFTKYSAPMEHYDWHIDRAYGRTPRKLSLSVQLSDPSSYEGGDLELQIGNVPSVASRNLGTVTAFPSFVLHRVTPVTKGIRYSLVAWITGRPFK